MNLKGLFIGLLFTVLYASGAIIMKIGLLSASPLTLATLRFLIAGVLLLVFIYGFRKGKYPLPNKREWGVLLLLGLLNTSLFCWSRQLSASNHFRRDIQSLSTHKSFCLCAFFPN
ncbi:EamA family transporter, partial [Clostridium perfringens]